MALATLAGGCSPPPAPVPRARSMVAALAEKLPSLRPISQNVDGDKRRFKDAPVYLDGKRVGVIRPLEVPSGLKPRMRVRPGAKPAPRYSIAEYVEAVGGDLAKVREVHLYGGRNRVSVVPGDELRKHRENLFFLFSGGARGKARIGWPTDGIAVNSSIDIVQAVAVYQEREPPRFDGKKGILHFGDGKAIEGIPYAPDEEMKGTRFYLDGVLLSWMKRKALPNSALAPGEDLASGRFSLRAYVASLGVDPAKIKAIELVQGDDAVTGFGGAALSSGPEVVFTLPRRSQGNILLWLGPKLFEKTGKAPAAEVGVRVSAVQLFSKLGPPKREYAKLEELTEKEDEARGSKGGGAESDQGDSAN